jgi:hypothetical protein
MISRAQAEEMMEEYLRGICRSVPGGLAIMSEYTLEKPYGWVFIEAANGRMTALGTGRSVERSLWRFESSRGLDWPTNRHIRLR